jgi:rubredoxin
MSDTMDRYRCTACTYIYDPALGDPDTGILPGTSFEDLPEDWVCPECGASKDQFEKVEEE